MRGTGADRGGEGSGGSNDWFHARVVHGVVREGGKGGKEEGTRGAPFISLFALLALPPPPMVTVGSRDGGLAWRGWGPRVTLTKRATRGEKESPNTESNTQFCLHGLLYAKALALHLPLILKTICLSTKSYAQQQPSIES